jgi:hypothetical protein
MLTTRLYTWRAFVLLGILLAAAGLTKASAIFLILLLPFVCLAQWTYHRSLRPIVLIFLTTVGVFALFWGFWLFYNSLRDLDPLGVARSVRISQLLALRPRHLPLIVPYLPKFWQTFTLDWSVGGLGFGPPYFYWAVALMMVAGIAGWLWAKPYGPERLLVGMHTSWMIPVVILFFASNLNILRVHGIAVPEGRLLLPLLPSLAWLIAGGWRGWWSHRWRDGVAYVMAFAWSLTAILLVTRHLPWLYPRIVAAQTEVYNPASSPWLYEEQVALRDVVIPNRITVGELTPVSLTWQVLDKVGVDYTISLQLLQPTNPQWTKVEEQNSYPGLGMNPTSAWSMGTLYRDRIYLRPLVALNGPTRTHVVVWVLDGAEDGDALTVVRDDLVQDPPVIHTIVLDPAMPLSVPEKAQITPVSFGNQLELVGMEQRIGRSENGNQAVGELVIYWRAIDPILEDYAVFIHWLNAAGEIVAQSDGMPNGGLSPTSLWRTDDVVRDGYVMPMEQIDAGIVERVHLGLYSMVTSQRLPALQEGEQLVDSSLAMPLQSIALTEGLRD